MVNWAEQPPLARAKRRAHRELSPPGPGARQDEVSEIGACNEQHESHGGLQHPEDASRRPHDRVLQRFHPHHVRTGGEYVSARANALTPARGERRELRVGLHRCHVILQTSEDREKVTRAILADGRSELERQPQLDMAVHEVETGRHDADHFPHHAVDLNRPAHHVLTRAEARLPQIVRQHDERGTTGARLLSAEPPPVLGLNGERLEQLGIHRRSRDTARPIACGQVHLADHKGTDDGEGLIDFRELPVFRRRHEALPALPAPEPRRQELELLRFGIAEWLQENRVDDGEDGRVRADTEGKRQHGNDSESGALAERAAGVADVLDDLVEPAPRPHGSHVL